MKTIAAALFVLLLTALSMTVADAADAADTSEQRITRPQWPQYANGPNIAALTQVQKILSGFDEKPGTEIIVRYPGGADGIQWAEQMRNWFIAYGVPMDYLKMEPGSGAPDLLLLILITRS